MKLKRPSKQDLIVFALFVLLAWVACIYLLTQATKQLTDLTRITAVLDSSSIVQSTGRAHPHLVVLKLNQHAERLGIYMGQSKEAAEHLASLLHQGDTLTVYYNANGMTTEGDINLHTFQIQTQRTVLYSLTEAQRGNKTGAWMAGLFAILSTGMWAFLLFLRKRKKQKEVAK